MKSFHKLGCKLFENSEEGQGATSRTHKAVTIYSGLLLENTIIIQYLSNYYFESILRSMINLHVKTGTFPERETLVLLLPDISWQFK